jgi:hypothetical protein
VTADQVIIAANELLKRVGLLDWNVKVVSDLNAFGRSRNVPLDFPEEQLYGLTCWAEKFIVLSVSILDDEEFTRNVVSHETAHAYHGRSEDHHSDEFGLTWCKFRRMLDKICGVEPDMRPGCVMYVLNPRTQTEQEKQYA